VSQIEGRLDDATQGTLGVGTEGRATFVSEGASPTGPVPSTVLVTWWSLHCGEVATSFHGVSENWVRVRVGFLGKVRGG
jgi:hypothetical protein